MTHNMIALSIALAFTYLVNIPFGILRAQAKRVGDRVRWFLAIHAPVPLVFAARTLAGASLTMIPVFVFAFFMGQYTGGKYAARTWNNVGTGDKTSDVCGDRGEQCIME